MGSPPQDPPGFVFTIGMIMVVPRPVLGSLGARLSLAAAASGGIVAVAALPVTQAHYGPAPRGRALHGRTVLLLPRMRLPQVSFKVSH